MEHASLSPAVARMTGLAAAMVRFEEGSLLLSELAGVKVNAKQVAVGTRLKRAGMPRSTGRGAMPA